MKHSLFLFLALAGTVLLSFERRNNGTTITVRNTLNVARTFETVVLTKAQLKLTDLSNVGIKDAKTGELQVTQLVDNDGDGTWDDILFQPNIAANSESTFEITTVTEAEQPKAEQFCYSRFVPERTEFEVSIKGTEQISAGLTLHEKDGVVTGNNQQAG